MNNILAVYECAWIINRIYEVSDKIRNRIVDQTAFEKKCIDRVGSYINKREENKHHRRYIDKMIRETASYSIKEHFKKEHYMTFSEISRMLSEDNSKEDIEFEPLDTLADVEADVLNKETINLLAEGDRQKKVILEAWSLGNTNNSLISRALADALGGNPESYRKSVNRFKKRCADRITYLSAAI
ncbi:hypothetical protein [Virgibacillus proomii]|uniref:hypothetical protein n=1 Tax=Virgibacillus proomii TaxID=84407 RepID=UPI001C124520|nr:hypothetical protein [Virgibacillus proomii]MBU5266242.1 hypothetical protein [Virgibacillus proomii]